MKKLLLLGSLAVCALSFAPAQADAWWLTNCCCGHHCSMKVTITPYNAFSPICAGNFCCVGCNPFCCGPQQPQQPPWGYGADFAPFCNSNCGESGCLPSTVPDKAKDDKGGTAQPNSGTSSAPVIVPQVPVVQGYPVPYGNPMGVMPQGYNPNFYNTVGNPYRMPPTMPVPNYNYQSNYNPYAYGMNPYAGYGMNPYGNVNPYGR